MTGSAMLTELGSIPLQLLAHLPRSGLKHVPARCSARISHPHRHHLLYPRQTPASVHRRYKTTSTAFSSVNVGPCSTIKPSLHPIDDAKAYPTVVAEAKLNMNRYSECVIITRVGSFYELYFDQADLYGPQLNLKVASKKTSAGPVSMAGFPFTQLDRYLKILVQDMQKRVAISEEYLNGPQEKASSGLMFNRRVTRIVTPGTLIDEKFMDQYENNFLLAISDKLDLSEEGSAAVGDATQAKNVGISWLDLSTGDFFSQHVSLQNLASVIARIGAREIVLAKDMEDAGFRDYLDSIIDQQRNLITQHSVPSQIDLEWWSSTRNSDDVIDQTARRTARKGSKVEVGDFTSGEIRASAMLMDYVKERLPETGLGLGLQVPVRRLTQDHMGIDKQTMRALEILGTAKDGVRDGKGSLLHTMRRTVTKSGARLLKDWISSPSLSIDVINQRLALVSLLLDRYDVREDLIFHLKGSFDTQRLTQKFSLGRGGPDDLLNLAKTIYATKNIDDILNHEILWHEQDQTTPQLKTSPVQALSSLRARFSLEGLLELADAIARSIDEANLIQMSRAEGGQDVQRLDSAQPLAEDTGSADVEEATIVKPSKGEEEQGEVWMLCVHASSTLSELHTVLIGQMADKRHLVDELQGRMGTRSMSLKMTPGLGFHCHVKGIKDIAASIGDGLTRDIRTTKSSRTFFHPEWDTLGRCIEETKARIRNEEQIVLQALRDQVVKNLNCLRQNGRVLDELDIGCSSATVAEEQKLTRPIINTNLEHNIIGGRHPTVSQGLEERGRSFVSNDCILGDKKERIWLVTGPNMAGKSTFLRQNALISILAQAGCFVPADRAELGLVDQIFTRVGSADNLYRDQSTFMVEMSETATILHQATPQSLVIMDEIGRGTTPEDGVAIGYACLHHLYTQNRCRTLFATHFHTLTDMTRDWTHLGCHCTDVAEATDGSFSYVHKLRPGVNRNSHALKVAALAGIPRLALDTAMAVLDELQNSHERQSTGVGTSAANE